MTEPITVKITRQAIIDCQDSRTLIVSLLKDAGIPINGNLGFGKKVTHGCLKSSRDFDTDSLEYVWRGEDTGKV